MARKRVSGRFVKATAEEETEPGMGTPAAVGAPSPSSAAKFNAPRPRFCKSFARKRLAEALPEIVGALVDKAKGGSVAHAKMLAELSGLTRAEVVPKVKRPRGKSFAVALLEEIEEQGSVPRD